MMLIGLDHIAAWLRNNNDLGESLLSDLRLTAFGYSVVAVFKLVIDAAGKPIEPRKGIHSQAAFQFDAVASLQLDGGLSEAMVASPDRINWGLSEVALVELTGCGPCIEFTAKWEGERLLRIVSHRVSMEIK